MTSKALKRLNAAEKACQELPPPGSYWRDAWAQRYEEEAAKALDRAAADHWREPTELERELWADVLALRAALRLQERETNKALILFIVAMLAMSVGVLCWADPSWVRLVRP